MDPVDLIGAGVSLISGVVGTASKATSDEMNAQAQAQNAQQQAAATRQDALAQQMDAESLRQEAKQQRTSAALVEDQAVASDYNSALNRQNATQIRQQYAENIQRLQLTQEQERGSIKAAAGASGVTLSGSALDVLGNAVANQTLDALTLKNEGEVQAIAAENSAKLNTMAAASARKNEAGIQDQATFIDSKAAFTDQNAAFLQDRANYISSTSSTLQTAGHVKAIGDIASGAATLFGRMAND